MNRWFLIILAAGWIVGCVDSGTEAQVGGAERAAAKLPSGNWRLTAMSTDTQKMELIGNVTLAIDEAASQVSGSAGCNRYTAAYELSENGLTIGPAAATKRFCGAPEGLMDQESAFLKLLANTHEIDMAKQGELTLKCAAGALVFSGELEPRDGQQKGD